jgi:formylglycine-generating enzyme required for sulfatase activity
MWGLRGSMEELTCRACLFQTTELSLACQVCGTEHLGLLESLDADCCRQLRAGDLSGAQEAIERIAFVVSNDEQPPESPAGQALRRLRDEFDKQSSSAKSLAAESERFLGEENFELALSRIEQAAGLNQDFLQQARIFRREIPDRIVARDKQRAIDDRVLADLDGRKEAILADIRGGRLPRAEESLREYRALVGQLGRTRVSAGQSRLALLESEANERRNLGRAALEKAQKALEAKDVSKALVDANAALGLDEGLHAPVAEVKRACRAVLDERLENEHAFEKDLQQAKEWLADGRVEDAASLARACLERASALDPEPAAHGSKSCSALLVACDKKLALLIRLRQGIATAAAQNLLSREAKLWQQLKELAPIYASQAEARLSVIAGERGDPGANAVRANKIVGRIRGLGLFAQLRAAERELLIAEDLFAVADGGPQPIAIQSARQRIATIRRNRRVALMIGLLSLLVAGYYYGWANNPRSRELMGVLKEIDSSKKEARSALADWIAPCSDRELPVLEADWQRALAASDEARLDEILVAAGEWRTMWDQAVSLAPVVEPYLSAQALTPHQKIVARMRRDLHDRACSLLGSEPASSRAVAARVVGQLESLRLTAAEMEAAVRAAEAEAGTASFVLSVGMQAVVDRERLTCVKALDAPDSVREMDSVKAALACIAAAGPAGLQSESMWSQVPAVTLNDPQPTFQGVHSLQRIVVEALMKRRQRTLQDSLDSGVVDGFTSLALVWDRVQREEKAWIAALERLTEAKSRDQADWVNGAFEDVQQLAALVGDVDELRSVRGQIESQSRQIIDNITARNDYELLTARLQFNLERGHLESVRLELAALEPSLRATVCEQNRTLCDRVRGEVPQLHAAVKRLADGLSVGDAYADTRSLRNDATVLRELQRVDTEVLGYSTRSLLDFADSFERRLPDRLAQAQARLDRALLERNSLIATQQLRLLEDLHGGELPARGQSTARNYRIEILLIELGELLQLQELDSAKLKQVVYDLRAANVANPLLEVAERRLSRVSLPWATFPKDGWESRAASSRVRDYQRISGLPWLVTDRATGLEMVLVPPGEFRRGSDDASSDPDEKPLHIVAISRPFYIARYEVTQDEWFTVMQRGKAPELKSTKALRPSFYGEKAGGDWRNRPVEQLTHQLIGEYLQIANRDSPDSLPLRLPTEAEWEYACLGGRTRDAQHVLKEVAHFGYASSPRAPFSRGSGDLQPNDYGIHHMLGNVAEMCSDWYHSTYYQQCVPRAVDPQGPASGSSRVVRGGDLTQLEASCRSWNRPSTGDRRVLVGFRPVRAVK